MDLATITHNLTLSTTDFNLVGDIKVRQADDETQMFEVTVIENGTIKSFGGLKPFFCLMAREVTGQGVSEEPVDVFDATKGIVKYTLSANAMQMVRRNEAYFSFRKENSTGRWIEQFSTKSFFYTVEKSIYTQPFKDSNYWFTFNELYKKFMEYQETGKISWEEFVDQNKEIIESVDPGGILLREIVDARKPQTENSFPTLSERLDAKEGLFGREIMKSTVYPLAIQTFDGSDEPYHPSVRYFESGWNGYHYWMAYTPYPLESTVYTDRWESPSIACSNDGITWITPAGFSNPLIDLTNDQISRKDYFSDTATVFVNNMLGVWYRHTNGATLATDIYRAKSSDGVTWTTPEKVVDYSSNNGLKTFKTFRAHTLNYMNNRYVVYSCSDYGIFRTESTDPSSQSWTDPVLITGDARPMDYWHASVLYDEFDDEYKLIGYDANKKTIEYCSSNDGINFTFKKIIYSVDERYFSNIENLYHAICVRVKDTWRIYSSCQIISNNTINTQKKNGIFLLVGQSLENMTEDVSYRSDFSRKVFNSKIFLGITNRSNSRRNAIILSKSDDERDLYGLSLKYDLQGRETPVYLNPANENSIASFFLNAGEPAANRPDKGSYVGEMYMDTDNPNAIYVKMSDRKWKRIDVNSDSIRKNMTSATSMNVGTAKIVVINVYDSGTIHQLTGGLEGSEVTLISTVSQNLYLTHGYSVTTGKMYFRDKANKTLTIQQAVKFINVGGNWYEV